MEGLAERIKAKLERDGLSLRDAGEQSGVAFSTLGRIANGKAPSVGVYHRIVAWLDGVGATLPTPPMTLRDWFAGQTLASIPLRNWSAETRGDAEVIKAWAACAYTVADAMLAERERGQ